MKIISILPSSTLVAFMLFGCATPKSHSFNNDFGENLPTKPQYYIEDENDNHFIIKLHQGTPSTGTERVINLKDAASTIAKSESERLGWEKWQLNYIQEKDQGWMHVVVAEVTRENYTKPVYPNSNNP